MVLPFKIGFIGAGNLAQAIIKGLIDSKLVKPEHIYASNRSEGKLLKIKELFGINTCQNNEAVIDNADIIILAIKPQDFSIAIEPLASSFLPQQIVISTAAGITLNKLTKMIPQSRIVRVMPNTPSIIGKGVIGFCTQQKDPALNSTIEDLFSALGYVVNVSEGEQFEALTVSCSAGTGFVYELMMYWQDWIEERGIPPEIAKQMTVDTFLGAAMLAAQSKDMNLEELQTKVASKKGVTEAGLESMRELEVERTIRYSFEKAALRDQALSKCQ